MVARASNRRFSCVIWSPYAERAFDSASQGRSWRSLTGPERRATLWPVLPDHDIIGSSHTHAPIRRCRMQKLIVVAFAALCLIGTSSLVLAEDAMKGETGNMKANKEEMKGKKKEHTEKMKAKRHEMKDKMKAHKDAAKAKGGETKGAAPAAPAPMSATAPTAAP